jgi:uncharacterized membrane protein
MFVTKQNTMKETTLRTTLRGTFWRIIVFLTSTLITYFLTGNVFAGLLVASCEFPVKLLVYVQFEKQFAKRVSFGLKNGKPTAKRSAVKGLVWRSIATVMSMTIALIVTKGDTHSAGLFGLIAFPTKFALYIAYEQLVWKKIEWGLKKPLTVGIDIDATVVTFKN